MTDEQKPLQDLWDIGMSLAERALYTERPKNAALADLASDAFWTLTRAINEHEARQGEPWPDHLPPYDRVSLMREEREAVRSLL